MKPLLKSFNRMSTAIAAASLVLVGCTGESPTALTTAQILMAQLTGSYQLQSLQGQPLPAVLALTSTHKIEITSDLIVMNADGTFTGQRRYRFSYVNGALIGEGCDCAEQGTYTASSADGSAITVALHLTNTTDVNYTGTLSGNQLTLTNVNGVGPWVYTR